MFTFHMLSVRFMHFEQVCVWYTAYADWEQDSSTQDV